MGYNGEIEFPGVIYKQSYMFVYIPPKSCSTLYLKVSFIFLGHEKYIKMLESIPYCSWEHLKPFFLQGIIINHFHTIRGKFFSSMKKIKIHFFGTHTDWLDLKPNNEEYGENCTLIKQSLPTLSYLFNLW